ncbi:FMN reductase [Methylocaldum szegediense]|jgi:FMN reductase|uniref:NADH-dependent FMN reductase SfnE n=1 Tax=Methylocaldum szegediense TaxID=73780 RepID=A0ABM9I9J7_9GAMM|nr:FMN reductase [Methylocaldum szegediense]CAI8975428.1 NADH-dependent FMN reductase SfnE [Methylocaldum szegediense]
MGKLNLVVVSGNLGSPSKTLALAEQIVDAIGRLTPIETNIHQLAELAPAIGPARHPGELGEAGKTALRAIETANILVAATPVYKGSYTGLFKHLFDFLDPKALNETPVILAATGGGEKHALIIEHQLRPLFGFFGAYTVPSGIYATERDFDGTRFSDPIVLERIETAARQAVHAAQALAARQRQARAA